MIGWILFIMKKIRDVASYLDSTIYIVAGDAMQKLMAQKYPNRKTIPFREDFSKGCLEFMIAYLKDKGYAGRIQVQIVNEYNLSLLREYFVE